LFCVFVLVFLMLKRNKSPLSDWKIIISEYEAKIYFSSVEDMKIIKKIKFMLKFDDMDIGLDMNCFLLQHFNGTEAWLLLKLPFIGTYKGNLCVESDCSLNFLFSVTNFSKSNEYSQFRCKYKGYERRICEMHRVGYIGSKIVFSFPTKIKFPSPFLIIGARTPPFDRVEDRLIHEPIWTSENIIQNTNNITIINSTSYIFGRFYNSMMLWHIIFDFLIPAYSTIRNNEGGLMNQERIVFLKDNEFNVFESLTSVLSSKQIINIIDHKYPLYFNKVFVGIEKFEKEISPQRDLYDMINFQYQLETLNTEGFRELVYNKFRIETTDTPKNQILIVVRKDKKRDLDNPDDVIRVIETHCNNCIVSKIDFSGLSLQQQVSKCSSASVIIGLHGSGLTNVIWMQKSTNHKRRILLEILPYNYWCRNWFHVAANISGVEYFSFMNSYPPNTNDTYNNILCYSLKSQCKSIQCHDWIRDKRVTVDIKEFEKTWLKIQQILND